MNLKNLFYALPALALFSCSGNSEPADTTDTTATVTPEVIDSNTVTAANAADVKMYEQNPESVTRYFYASRIRGDKSWESVCHLPEERTPKFVADLADLDTKKISRYKHLETDWLENACNVHVELEWTSDTVTTPTLTEYIVFLENIDGIWWIIGFSDAVQA